MVRTIGTWVVCIRPATFLDVEAYQNVKKWAELIDARPAVQRGRMVNKVSGDLCLQLHERHDASDFDTKTQDKILNFKFRWVDYKF